MCAPRLGEPRPRYTAPSSGNRGGGCGVRGCPLASSHLGEGFILSRRRQRWRAPAAGIRKTPAGHREVKEPASGSKRSIGSTWSPGKVSLGEKEAKKEEGASGNPGNSYEISPGAASRAQRQPGLTPWAAWRMLLAPLHHRASGPVRLPKALTEPCGAAAAASRAVTESQRGGGELGTRCNLEDRFAVFPPPPCGSSETFLCLPLPFSLLTGDLLRSQ